MLRVVVLIATVVSIATAFPSFQNEIPNGRAVPNPCGGSGDIWLGVGHLNPGGGGPRNPFGLDFNQAGRNWTVELCQKDSDGDGMTNGQELGDPDCKWSKRHSKKINLPAANSHPGICEPIGSEKCSDNGFSCPA